MGGIELTEYWAHRRRVVMSAPDPADAARDARSDARYEDDPQAERDDLWRETLPARGCDS